MLKVNHLEIFNQEITHLIRVHPSHFKSFLPFLSLLTLSLPTRRWSVTCWITLWDLVIILNLTDQIIEIVRGFFLHIATYRAPQTYTKGIETYSARLMQ